MKEKVLIVTGSTGIASETIQLAARRGARICFGSRNEDNCLALHKRVQGWGGESVYLSGDLCDPVYCKSLVSLARERYGRIDGLYNVAGASGRQWGDGPADACTDNGWEKTLDLNLGSQFRMCREVINVMLGQEPGRNGQRGAILNMSSILGLNPQTRYFDTIAYATAKGAIISMTRSMAGLYAAKGIRVNAIAPALVETRMSARASADEQVLGWIEGKQPLVNGMMHPEDLAEASVFLLGQGARAITGQTLVVDAGWSVT